MHAPQLHSLLLLLITSTASCARRDPAINTVAAAAPPTAVSLTSLAADARRRNRCASSTSSSIYHKPSFIFPTSCGSGDGVSSGTWNSDIQPNRHNAKYQCSGFQQSKRMRPQPSIHTLLSAIVNKNEQVVLSNIEQVNDEISQQYQTQNQESSTIEGDMKQRQKTRFRSRISYFGTPFHGWQLQPERSTVQGEIEDALSRRFHRRIPVVGAGRTDAGVHARGQAIHFDLLPDEIPFVPPSPPELSSFVNEHTLSSADTTTSSTMTKMGIMADEQEQQKCDDFCNELEYSLNRMLPLDIRVFQLQRAPYTLEVNTLSNTDENGSMIDGDDYDDENDIEDENNEFQTQQQQSPATYSPRPRPWHVIQSANSKWYSYRFILGPTLWNPMDRFTRTHFVHRPIYSPPASNETSSSSSLAVSRNANNDDTAPYALTKQDMDRLQSILRLYEGTHDFGAFGGQIEQTQKKNKQVMNTVRTVYRVELVKEPLMEDYIYGSSSAMRANNDGSIATSQSSDVNVDPVTLHEPVGFIGEEGNYRIDFLLHGALYKMVRNMVGTAIEVWLGRMKEEKLVELLHTPQLGNEAALNNDTKLGRKDNPCKPAPPEGLTLECVYYDDGF